MSYKGISISYCLTVPLSIDLTLNTDPRGLSTRVINRHIISHLLSSSSAPSPSLRVCPSPPSAPFLRTKQTRARTRRLLEKSGDTIDHILGQDGVGISSLSKQ